MAKNKNNEAPAPKKSRQTTVTGARKARKVLQSNGLHFFKEWAEKSASGGRRKNGSRPAFKSDQPSLYRQLVSKGEVMNRRMDNPPVPKDQPQDQDQPQAE